MKFYRQKKKKKNHSDVIIVFPSSGSVHHIKSKKKNQPENVSIHYSAILESHQGAQGSHHRNSTVHINQPSSNYITCSICLPWGRKKKSQEEMKGDNHECCSRYGLVSLQPWGWGRMSKGARGGGGGVRWRESGGNKRRGVDTAREGGGRRRDLWKSQTVNFWLIHSISINVVYLRGRWEA